MAAKIFEVGDVLPATTQLRISWNNDVNSYFSHDEYFFIENNLDNDLIAIFSVEFYIDNITIYSSNSWISPYGSRYYIDLDTTTWSSDKRTIKSIDDTRLENPFSWEDLNAPSGYTITFNSNGGTTISDIEEASELPTLPTPTKSGYTFVAWYYESNFQTRAKAGDTIESNVTLYAKWHNLGSLFTEIADAIRSKDGTSENIRDVDFGERIKQIQGAKEEQTKTVTPTTSSQDVLPDTNKVLSKVTVNAIPTETKSQQPNLSSGDQTINATSGKFMTSFTITKDTINHIASNIRSGITLYGVTGNLQSAKEEETKTVTPNFSSGNVDVTPTSGKVMTQVTINKDGNLIADNIKKDVTVHGITGTLESGGGSLPTLTSTPTNPFLSFPVDENNVYTLIASYKSSLTLWGQYDDAMPEGIMYIYYSNGEWVKKGTVNRYGGGWSIIVGVTDGIMTVRASDSSGSYDDYMPYIYLFVGDTITGKQTKIYTCFIKGTQITLADGTTKNVEDITYDDKLLTWNFDEGRLDTADIFWIAKESKAPLYWEVTFSDNTKLGLVGAKNKSHRLFNLEQGKFAYPQDFNEGEHTIKEDGSLVTITSCVKLQKEVTYYNLATSKRLNNYANGILTGCRFTNIYPIQDMKYVKDDRPLIAREEYKEIPDKYFDGLRLAEQPLDTQNGDVNYFNTTKEHVIHNYIEHEKNWQGAKDYKQWEFKKGRNEN
jgi:uncharacterized repeat protein (TIGR02543 family)